MIALAIKPSPSGSMGNIDDHRENRPQIFPGDLKNSVRELSLGKPRSLKRSPVGKLSIYLIEDDPHFRETFLDVMSLRGVEAHSAASGAQALRELETLRPAVIIVDVRLPDVHGFDLCRLIRRMEDFSKTPIILISASFRYNDPRDQVEGLLAGASVFLSKPITMENLWSEIDGLLKRGGS